MKLGCIKFICCLPLRHGAVLFCVLNILLTSLYELYVVLPEVYHFFPITKIDLSALKLVFLLLTCDVLHLTGLMHQNHLLLLPFFMTTIVRICDPGLVIWTVGSNLGLWANSKVRLHSALCLAYVIFLAYSIFINVILYRKFLGQYRAMMQWIYDNERKNVTCSKVDVSQIECNFQESKM